MTGPAEATSNLVEVVLHVAAEHEELAAFHLGELSPGGFRCDTRDDGSVEFGVYVETDRASSVESYLTRAGVPVESSIVAIVPDDWAERWKEFHHAVVIGDLWVGPPWLEDERPAHLKPVVIEPAQGFGTGAHPTTRLVLTLLATQPRASVLDLGCGSGVLAIAAQRLGFVPITAVDNDPLALDSTRSNLERNDVHGVRVGLVDALQDDIPRADIVLANILLEPLLRIAPKLRAPRLILSGILTSQVGVLQSRYEQQGYVLRELRERDGWAALVMERVDPEESSMRYRSVF